MIALWQRLTDYWPQWESLYGTVDDSTIYGWTGALNRFTEAELAGAIRSCEDWTGRYPPTFPEFKSLCVAAKADLESIAHQPGDPEVKSLEHLAKVKREDTPVIVAEKKRLQKLLKGQSVESKEESIKRLGLE
jgi:hypothetical protein